MASYDSYELRRLSVWLDAVNKTCRENGIRFVMATIETPDGNMFDLRRDETLDRYNLDVTP